MTADIAQLDAARARQLTDRIKTALGATWELAAEAYKSRAWAALGYASWDDYTTQEFGTARLRLPKEDRAEAVASLRESGLSLRAISAVTGDSVTTVRRELAGVPNGTPAEDEPASPIGDSEEPVSAIADELVDVEPAGVEPHEPYDGYRAAPPLRRALPITPTEIAELQVPTPVKVTGTDGKQYAARTTQTAPRQKPITDAANALGFELRKNADRLAALVGDKRYAQNEEQVTLLLRGHLLHVAETVAAVLDQMPNS